MSGNSAPVWTAALLAGVAGSVDAVGFLVLLHLFTAHMSGNSIATGAYAGTGQWTEAARRAFPIPVFVLGVAAGAALMELGRRRRWRAPNALVLTLEAALLTLFLLAGSAAMTQGVIPATPFWRFAALASLLPLAMGLQNAALRRAAGQNVRTTYVSGMLTSGTEQMVNLLFWLRDRTRGRGVRRLRRALLAAPRQKSWEGMVLPLGIWLFYMTGAALAAVLESRRHLDALLLPLAGLAVVIGADLRQPADVKPPK